MALTDKEKIEAAALARENFLQRTLGRFDKYFSGPEHEYQVAIQTDEYTLMRRDFIDICFRTAKDHTTAKELIADDYKKWVKNAR
jgi:hypothetical protein